MAFKVKKEEERFLAESSVEELVERSSSVEETLDFLSETSEGFPRIPIQQGLGSEFSIHHETGAHQPHQTEGHDQSVQDLVRPLQKGDRIHCRYVYDSDKAASKNSYLGDVYVTFKRDGEDLIPGRFLEGGILTSEYCTNGTKHIVIETNNFALDRIVYLLRKKLNLSIKLDLLIRDEEDRRYELGDEVSVPWQTQEWLMVVEKCRLDVS